MKHLPTFDEIWEKGEEEEEEEEEDMDEEANSQDDDLRVYWRGVRRAMIFLG